MSSFLQNKDNPLYQRPKTPGVFVPHPGAAHWQNVNDGKCKGNVAPAVLQAPLFSTADGYTPSIGFPHSQIDHLSIHRSRIGVVNNSLHGSLGIDRMERFEKLVHFLVQCMEEESCGGPSDFRAFPHQPRNRPGEKQAGSTLAELQDPKWHVSVANRCHEAGLTCIERLMALSEKEWHQIDLPIRFAQLKLKALVFMKTYASRSFAQAEFWTSVGRRQRKNEKGRSFNFPLDCSVSELKEAEKTAV